MDTRPQGSTLSSTERTTPKPSATWAPAVTEAGLFFRGAKMAPWTFSETGRSMRTALGVRMANSGLGTPGCTSSHHSAPLCFVSTSMGESTLSTPTSMLVMLPASTNYASLAIGAATCLNQWKWCRTTTTCRFQLTTKTMTSLVATVLQASNRRGGSTTVTTRTSMGYTAHTWSTTESGGRPNIARLWKWSWDAASRCRPHGS